jgi:hypothetical protein
MKRSALLLLLAAAILFVIVGCSSDGGGGVPSGPSAPNIAGTYVGEWGFDFDAGLFSAFFVCNGSVTLTQSGTSLGGSFSIAGGDELCGITSGDVVEGRITDTGSPVRLNLVLRDDGASRNGLFFGFDDDPDCDIVSEDERYGGSVFSAGNLAFIAEAVVRCSGQNVDVFVLFEGS